MLRTKMEYRQARNKRMVFKQPDTYIEKLMSQG